MTTQPTLLAVAHGSRNPAGRETVEALLAEVRRQRPDLTALSVQLTIVTVIAVAAVVTLRRPAPAASPAPPPRA